MVYQFVYHYYPHTMGISEQAVARPWQRRLPQTGALGPLFSPAARRVRDRNARNGALGCLEITAHLGSLWDEHDEHPAVASERKCDSGMMTMTRG